MKNLDIEDWGYFLGTACISCGAGWFSIGAGLCCAGVLMVFPAVLSILRGGPPQKGHDG
jgi:hypothetical protein